MNIEIVEKKVREARFFLDKMKKQEQRAFGDKEPFDFYLSAFLNAGMSVRTGFHVRQDRARDAPIKAWRESWEQALPSEERGLFKFMLRDRVAEVHDTGSRVKKKIEEVPVLGELYLEEGTKTKLETLAPPGAPPASIRRPAYTFIIEGTEHKAMDACAKYLELLNGMVAAFKVKFP
jgi:hypothetical protein